jgi:hypothetical protein
MNAKVKCATTAAAAVALFALTGCYQKGSLEGSQVEVVKVEGRRFEVRVTPTGTPNEYRMLIIRATMVVNPDPEREMARAREVSERYMAQTCKGKPYEQVLAGLQGDINYRVLFRCT